MSQPRLATDEESPASYINVCGLPEYADRLSFPFSIVMNHSEETLRAHFYTNIKKGALAKWGIDDIKVFVMWNHSLLLYLSCNLNISLNYS